jgi:hypothetical protein
MPAAIWLPCQGSSWKLSQGPCNTPCAPVLQQEPLPSTRSVGNQPAAPPPQHQGQEQPTAPACRPAALTKEDIADT